MEPIGTCSICGGPVMGHRVWHGITPPPPGRCSQCGAVEKRGYGPVIEMTPAAQYVPYRWTTSTGEWKPE